MMRNMEQRMRFSGRSYHIDGYYNRGKHKGRAARAVRPFGLAGWMDDMYPL
jgi:hypothetical protein